MSHLAVVGNNIWFQMVVYYHVFLFLSVFHLKKQSGGEDDDANDNEC